MQEHKLLTLLQAHGIPLGEWGVGEAKTLSHLLSETQSGEAAVFEEDGGLIRSTQVAALLVYCADGNHVSVLREDRQVFKDGREKRRSLETSIGEKVKPGETPMEAAYRALREELKITDRLELVTKPSVVKGPVPSQSFPGLMTRHVIHVFEVFLPKHLYKPEGYVEEQEDKTNYYVWA